MCKRFYLFLLLLHATTINPMGTIAGKGVLLAKKALPKICTGIYWGINFVPLAIAIRYQTKHTDCPPDAPASKFLTKELENAGIPQPKNPKIGACSGLMGAYLNKQLIIDEHEFTRLNSLLSKKEDLEREIDNNKTSRFKALGSKLSRLGSTNPNAEDELRTLDEKLNYTRAIIHHEATHMKRNSPEVGTAGRIATPIAIHAGIKSLAQKIGNKQTNPSLIRHLLKIPGGLGLLIASNMASLAWSNYEEQQADDGIPDDPDLLKAIAKEFQELGAKHKEMYRSKYNLTPEKMDKVPARWFYKMEMDPTHPLPENRAQKFEQRLAQLEAEKNKTI